MVTAEMPSAGPAAQPRWTQPAYVAIIVRAAIQTLLGFRVDMIDVHCLTARRTSARNLVVGDALMADRAERPA